MEEIELGASRESELQGVDERELTRPREIRRVHDAEDGIWAWVGRGVHGGLLRDLRTAAPQHLGRTLQYTSFRPMAPIISRVPKLSSSRE
jgi:hypothetical protein